MDETVGKNYIGKMINVTSDTHGQLSELIAKIERIALAPDDVMMIPGDTGLNFRMIDVGIEEKKMESDSNQFFSERDRIQFVG